MSACYRSCTLVGLKAACISEHHHWVPVLPSNITHLFLELNYIKEINMTSLRRYGQLQQLDLGMQRVPLTIRNNAFLRQSKLTKLVLSANVGLQLEPRAFAGLFRLKDLFLSYCSLKDSILETGYLQPLLFLETLDLARNEIVRLRPAAFFPKLTRFKELNLKLNQIERLCEGDLAVFKGKRLVLLDLSSNRLVQMASADFDWEGCGNPFRQISLDTLDISTTALNVEAASLLFKAIQGSAVTHLIFSGYIGKGFSFDNMRDPDKSTFEGLANSTVNILDLSGSLIFALQDAVFSPLKDIKVINISRNKVNVIHRNAFDGIQEHLQRLNLSYNLLGAVTADTFANLTGLVVLDLSYNHIGVLGYKSFSGLPNLRFLWLTGNSLRDLGSPASLPSLHYLLLNDNKLKSMKDVLTLAVNGIHVDVADNRLTNLEDVYDVLSKLTHLENLFYGGNTVHYCVPDKRFSVPKNNRLQALDLHDSSLEIVWARGDCLDLFAHLGNLLTLNLSHNSLTSLPRDIFAGLSSIIELDLSHNSLMYLQPNVFPVTLKYLFLSDNLLATPDPMMFHSVTFLSLEGNLFHCDCHLESFLKWLMVTDVALKHLEEYVCVFPVEFSNVPLLDYSRLVEPCEKDDEEAVRGLKFALFVLSALLTVTVILSGITYARLRGRVFIIYKKIIGRVLEGTDPIRHEDEAQYDIYLCFSNSDHGWVEAALLKKLDSQFSEENVFHCCFEARDFLPGEDHLSNIRDAVWGSRKTVCVVSKHFLKGAVFLM